MNEYYDIVIVGAGVAGSAAATTFKRQGHEVLLLERSLKEPDRIVGELLQPGGVAALDQLELGSAVDDINAIPVGGYHIYWKDEEVTFHYPALNESQDSSNLSASSIDLTPGAKYSHRSERRSFHHGRFVSRLRDTARTEAKVALLEGTVTSILTDKHIVKVIGVDCSCTGV